MATKKLSNNDRLRLLMAQHNLTRREVREIISGPYGEVSQGTVDSWLTDKPSYARNMPGPMLELLERKLIAG
jgi:hypothetical protein